MLSLFSTVGICDGADDTDGSEDGCVDGFDEVWLDSEGGKLGKHSGSVMERKARTVETKVLRGASKTAELTLKAQRWVRSLVVVTEPKKLTAYPKGA